MAGRRAVLLALGGALAALPAAAQGQAPDSLDVLRQARSEQAAFERFRYNRLPRTPNRGSGPCTERIGRWCFWFSPATGTELPAQPPAVARRRGVLVHRLSEAAEAAPGEPWIVGQLVRYLVESDDVQGAVAVTHGCRAEPWWCRALEGYALHHGGRIPEAEAAFAGALATMPEAVRARWTDPGLLLRPADRRALGAMDAPARAEAGRRLWWLADPLWSEPGNDRLTEHYARWTVDRIQERARQVDRTPWADDSREVLVRYGPMVAWERAEGPIHARTAETSVIGHGYDRSWEWIPPLSMALDPATLRSAVWPLEEEAPTATRYRPAQVRRMLPLVVQAARFRRPDGQVLVLGYALPADSLPSGARLRLAAVAMAGPEGPAREARRDAAPATGTLSLRLPAGAAVLSVEVRDDSTGTLARWREGLAPAVESRISELLLLAHPDARPTELAEAARIARASAQVRAGEQVAVFWELYGVAATDSLTLTVALVAPRAGWVRRRLQALGVAGAPRPVRTRAAEGTAGGDVVSRSLAVALPAELRPGDYTLEVTVRAPGFPAATARRALTVVR